MPTIEGSLLNTMKTSEQTDNLTSSSTTCSDSHESFKELMPNMNTSEDKDKLTSSSTNITECQSKSKGFKSRIKKAISILFSRANIHKIKWPLFFSLDYSLDQEKITLMETIYHSGIWWGLCISIASIFSLCDLCCPHTFVLVTFDDDLTFF